MDLSKLTIFDVAESYIEGKEISTNPSESFMKKTLEEYVDFINKKDIQSIVNLYADKASYEVPVGTEPLIGNEAIKNFWNKFMPFVNNATFTSDIHLSPNKAATMTILISLNTGNEIVEINAADFVKFEESGKIIENKCHWGPQNIKMIQGNKDDFLKLFNIVLNEDIMKRSEHMKNVLESYIDKINNKDGGLFKSMYGEYTDLILEDPDGIDFGIFLKQEVSRPMPFASKVVRVAPVSTSFGDSACLPFDIYINFGKDIIIHCADIMHFRKDGFVYKTKAYWGKDNVTVLN